MPARAHRKDSFKKQRNAKSSLRLRSLSPRHRAHPSWKKLAEQLVLRISFIPYLITDGHIVHSGGKDLEYYLSQKHTLLKRLARGILSLYDVISCTFNNESKKFIVRLKLGRMRPLQRNGRKGMEQFEVEVRQEFEDIFGNPHTLMGESAPTSFPSLSEKYAFGIAVDSIRFDYKTEARM